MGKGKFSEVLHPRDPSGKFKGTSLNERKSRNLKRKAAAGAGIGLFVPIPGVGSAAGAAVGAAVAHRQNKKGLTPEYGAYSAKRSGRKKAAAATRANKQAVKALKAGGKKPKAIASGKTSTKTAKRK